MLAARRLIVEDGFRALSIRKLASEIQYSPAAIYLYFESREAIARELCLQGYRELLRCLHVAIQATADPQANLRACFAAYVNFGLSEVETYRLIFIDEPEYLAAAFANWPADNPATQAYRLLLDVAQAVLCVDGGEPPRLSVVEFAETCWAAMHGIVSLKLTCPAFPTTPVEVLGRSTVELLLRGLRS